MKTTEKIIEDIGVGFRHGIGFTIDRPRGLHCHLFLHFLTKVEILTCDGIIEVLPGTCLIYSPKHPQWYRGKNTGLGNDWFHADSAFTSTLVKKYKLPVNRPINPGQSSFILPILTEIRREFMEKRPFSEYALKLLVEKLFMELARHLEEKLDDSLTPRKFELIKKLRELRFKVHENFTKRWTVEEMAKMCFLSSNRFTVLYKEFFHKSPIEDLLEVRLERAKWLLSSSHLSVSEAAEQSGFENIYYFSRIFKRWTGVSPRDFSTGKIRK